MRPTTSTSTNNSKTSGKFWKLRSWVSPFRDQNSIQQFLWLVVSEVLPTQDIILNEIASGESNLVILRSLFWREKLRCKFVIEKEKIDWLLSPPWLRMEQNLCQIMAGRSLFLFTKLWTEGRRRIFLSETENEFTRRKLRNHETPRYW